jgi:hypothetical protein
MIYKRSHAAAGLRAKARLTTAAAFSLAGVLGALCVAAPGGASGRSQQGEVRREVVINGEPAEVSRQQQTAGAREWKTTWSDGSERVEVRARDFRLTDDATGIKSLARGGYFVLDEERGGAERQLKVTPDAGGRLRYDYHVGGEAREFDSAAQSWLSGVLLKLVRSSDFASGQRVKWLYGRRGVAGVLEEISSIQSSPVRRAYFQRLFETTTLDSDAAAQVFEQATRELETDSERSRLLSDVSGLLVSNAELRAPFFRAVEALGSDFERRRVLVGVANLENVNKETLGAALQSSLSMKSDFELAEWLIELARVHTIDESLRPGFLAGVRKMQSTHEQGRALVALTQNVKPRAN